MAGKKVVRSSKKVESKKSGKRVVPKRSFKYKAGVFLFKVGMGFAAFLFVFLLLVYMGFFGKLPDFAELKNIKHHSASEVYSADGELMGKYFVENRSTIDNAHISRHVKNALIATEDSRFFEHEGFDVVSLGRVLVFTVILGDHAQGGGSTISQQLAKNLYPRKNIGFLTMPVSKAKEIFTASRLEKLYSKDEILALYLNTVPFGEDVYGIEAAALRFFSKSAGALNAKEAATLVGMLAANTAYNPRLYPERSIKRRNIVLSRMLAQKFISQEACSRYQAEPTGVIYRRVDRNHGIAPYFREKVRVKVQNILEEAYGDEYDIYSSGLKIYTSIDSRLQFYADRSVKGHMVRLQKEFNAHWKGREPWENNPQVFERAFRNTSRYKQMKNGGASAEEILRELSKKRKMRVLSADGERTLNLSPVDSLKLALKTLHCGFIAINPQNGHILSWVGGRNHKFFPYDHVTARRQVGSTFKPIVYTAALMDGVEPCEYFSNEQRVYREYDDWSPANADGKHDGYYTLKGGLTNSVNTITAEVAVRTGLDEIVHLAENMGVAAEIPLVPSIALGTAELSLHEMMRVYGAFANYGIPVEPVGVLRVVDRHGKVLYEHAEDLDAQNVFDEVVAHTIIQMLKGVVDNGTGKSLRSRYHLKSDLGGKTGTTQNNADGWFIGFTPKLVAGAWVGADHPSIHFRSTLLGQGAHTALPIFGGFMKKVEGDARFDALTRSSFYPLPEELAHSMDCKDYSEDDPDMSFFDRMFDGGRKSEARKEMERKRKERQKSRKKGSLLDRMKELFKK